MKLYTFPMSNNAMKVVAVIKHLGLDAQSELVDLSKGKQLEPGFVKLNPNHMIPTLQDGDFVLWESNAIMQYLCTKKPGTSLYPSDPTVQCDINRWMFWQSGHLGPAVGAIQFERMIKGMLGAGAPDEAVVAAALDRFNRFAKVLDGHLAGREWIVGDALSLADFSVGSCFVYAAPAGLPMDGYPNVERFYAKLCALPAWAAATAPGQ